MPTTIGPITNVPLPGDPVDNDWAVDLTTFAVNDITIGATAPTDPNAELWYDTSDNGVSFANMPRGMIAHILSTNAYATTGTHTNFQDTGMTLTINETAGRRLRFTNVAHAYSGAVPLGVEYAILRNGVIQKRFQVPAAAMDSGSSMSLTNEWVVTSAIGGTGVIWKMQIKAQSGNTSVQDYAVADNARWFMCEDIGGS